MFLFRYFNHIRKTLSSTIEFSVMKHEDVGHYVAVARKFGAEISIHRNIHGGIDSK